MRRGGEWSRCGDVSVWRRMIVQRRGDCDCDCCGTMTMMSRRRWRRQPQTAQKPMHRKSPTDPIEKENNRTERKQQSDRERNHRIRTALRRRSRIEQRRPAHLVTSRVDHNVLTANSRHAHRKQPPRSLQTAATLTPQPPRQATDVSSLHSRLPSLFASPRIALQRPPARPASPRLARPASPR